VLSTVAQAQPLPVPKVGQCPSGYTDSGGYCAPTSDRAPAAVPRVGQCPSGFVQCGGLLSRHPPAVVPT
jgi:hypothetical protein